MNKIIYSGPRYEVPKTRIITHYIAPEIKLEFAGLASAILAESNGGTAPELEEGWTIEW